MDSDRFRQLLDSPGSFAAVYFNDSHDTHDAELRKHITVLDGSYL